MALPFLPEDQISRAFRKLKRKAATRPLQELAEYVENTWITSTTWPPASWSVYLQAVRTNNDVEGWHYGLNRRAQGKNQLPLYMLIMLLHEESRVTHTCKHSVPRYCFRSRQISFARRVRNDYCSLLLDLYVVVIEL